MTQRQRQAVDALMRQVPLDFAADLAEQRQIFAELMAAHPLPEGVEVTPTTIGGIDAVEVIPASSDNQRDGEATILYLHGGAYAVGSAESTAGLAAQVALKTELPVVSVDYRLAPEDPFPAAVEDAVAAYRGLLADRSSPSSLAVVGESAGAGLALATLLVAKEQRLPLPAAIALFSPWVDLTLSGDTLQTKAALDPSLTAAGLQRRVPDYVGATDPSHPHVSPLFANLGGLPPLLIQVGSHEILLDDATRLAAKAAYADVEVTLEVVPQVPHVFQAFGGLLDEADQALTRCRAFIRDRLGLVPL